MQGITIICSIIAAVCVFQTAEAGIFDTLTGSLPIKQTPNPLGNLGNVIKSNPVEICMKAYNDGVKTIDEVKTTFGTCFSDKTNPDTNKNIQQLGEAVDKLQASASKAYEEALKCGNNILNVMPCLKKVYDEKAHDLTPLLQDVIDAAEGVLQMSRENLSECYQMAIETSQNIIDNLVKNGEECVNSIKKFFPF